MRIGVLALQGAFARASRPLLRAIGVEARRGAPARSDLDEVDGLILPGGESTTMRQLIDRWGLREPILDLAASGAPLFGTCAGMILLAREIAGGEEPDPAAARRRRSSATPSVASWIRSRRSSSVPLLGDTPVHAVFIRAPDHRAGRARRRRPGAARRRADRGRARAQRHRHLVPPGARRRDALPPPGGHDGRASTTDPGEGTGRRPHPTRRTRGSDDREATVRHERRGKVRAARLTDLAALGELSPAVPRRDVAGDALAGAAGHRPADRRVQPVPAAARCVPTQRPAVRLRARTADSPACVRVERESHRDEWTIVELDAVGHGRRRRHPLPPRPAAPARRRRSAAPRASTSPAPMPTTTSSCSCRPASRATARSGSSFRDAEPAAPGAVDRRAPARGRDPARDGAGCRRPDAAVHGGDPRPGAPPRGVPHPRLGAPGHALAGAAHQPRADPALRRRRGYVLEAPDGGRTGRSSTRFVQVGVAKEDQPHYLKVMAPARGGLERPHRLRAGRHRGSAGPKRRPALRRTASSLPCEPMSRRSIDDSRRRASDDRHRHAAHEGNPRPRRRTGARAGRRPLTALEVTRGIRGSRRAPRNHRRPRRPARRRCRPEIVAAIHALPDQSVADRGRPGPGPPARGALPGFAR